MKPTFKYYADVLRAKVPVLFKDKYQVKAEFSRSIAGKNGFIITRVEYTKESGRRHIAITHAGAQVSTRNAFLPQYWPIRDAGFSQMAKNDLTTLCKQTLPGLVALQLT